MALLYWDDFSWLDWQFMDWAEWGTFEWDNPGVVPVPTVNPLANTVNYVRTLLLNEPRLILGTNILAEEYVSSSFNARELTPLLSHIRAAMFGSEPDRYMLNYRLYQLMQVLHASKLEEYVTVFDDRLTYLPLNRTELYRDAFCATVTKGPGVTNELYVSTMPAANEATGLLRRLWRVRVDTASTGRLWTDIPGTPSVDTFNYTKTGGLSDAISLLGSDGYFKFNGTVGDEWVISTVSRPVKTMVEVLADVTATVSAFDQDILFGTGPAEPFRTFRKLWNNKESYTYKLGALLLAVAYRTAECPEV